jgi:hypothetical protein
VTKQEAKDCQRGDVVEYQGQRATLIGVQLHAGAKSTDFQARFQVRTADGTVHANVDYRQVQLLSTPH